MSSRPLLSLALSLQARLKEICEGGGIPLTGHGLDVAAVLAVARYNCFPSVAEEVLVTLSHSADTLSGIQDNIQNGLSGPTTVYGINTGFGGSSDTRTEDPHSLGTGLLQLLQSAVMMTGGLNMSVLSQQQSLVPDYMLASWTRATMVVRINQCVRGHSAISRITITSLLKLFVAGVIPMVPLRGTVSASGDLIPLSYIAGTLEGSPDISVIQGHGPSARILPAREALADIGMKPLKLGPREALGLVNGTGASAAAASLAILDAMQLTLVSAGLTCLVSEGMAARVQWLHPFISETRPHPGQREVASIMRAFLKGSSLVSDMEEGEGSQHYQLNVRPSKGLAQDRYPLRTSPQWLGPQFEDLLLAYSQITVELNSSSDNPLTDPSSGSIYHGGNFQAVSITSAVEKIRSGLQMVGKLLFSQCTEMLNHQMSAGLPPNLAADDPSVSFCCKGLDICLAAYQSELSFLSNSMSNHVQSAEMHNQAVNSLAFLSTRYTMQAAELLGMMVAGVLYSACQAIDLRVMHATFLEAATATISKSYARIQRKDLKLEIVEVSLAAALQSLQAAWWNKIIETSLAAALQSLQNAWWDNAAVDAPDRCLFTASAFVNALYEPSRDDPSIRLESDCFDLGAKEMRQLKGDLQVDLLRTYQIHRSDFMQEPTSERYIGEGSKALYLWVRKDLGIPMHHGLEDHPVPGEDSVGKRTIGSQVSKIYKAVRDGELFGKFATTSKDLGLNDENFATASKDLGLNGQSFLTVYA